MTQETITADEYRTAAKVADAEGDTDLAAILKQRATNVAARDAYTNELIRSVLDTWLTVEGATSLDWWRAQVAGITRAVLAKLETDGRLVPAGEKAFTTPKRPGFKPVERCRCGVLEDEPSEDCEWHAAEPEWWATWQEVPYGVAVAFPGRQGQTLEKIVLHNIGDDPCCASLDGSRLVGRFVRAEAGEQG